MYEGTVDIRFGIYIDQDTVHTTPVCFSWLILDAMIYVEQFLMCLGVSVALVHTSKHTFDKSSVCIKV